jgi:hypothetical protein
MLDQTDQTAVNKTTKISTSLPTHIYDKLVRILRSPFSRADEGKLDRGVMAEWVFNAALSSIENKGLHDAMEAFITAKGLMPEFKQYYVADTKELM